MEVSNFLIMIKLNPLFFPSSKSIVVFGRNKLNGTDAIMPLLLELAEIKNKKIIFCVSNHNFAYKPIHENVVFRDILIKHGSLNLLGGFSKFQLLRYFKWMLQLSLIFMHGFFGGKLIHYGEINKFPFSLLRISFQKRVILMDNNTNETFYETALDKIKEVYKNQKLIKKKLYLFNSECHDKRVIFKKSIMKKYKINNDYKFYFFGRTRSRSFWLEYLSANKDYYFDKYHPEIKSEKYIVIVGSGYYGNYYANIESAFIKMLDILKVHFCDYHFFYKPHPLTPIEFVIEQFQSRELNYSITYLHPNILVTRAHAFVSNAFSNLLIDAYLFGIPTIEFSNYTDWCLEITNGNSTSTKYVDYFIDNDPKKFVKTLNNVIVNSKKTEVNLTSFSIDEKGSEKVLNLF
jgi:hypothetical protein